MRRDVIEPAAAAVESREGGGNDAIALAAHDAEPRVARGHRGKRHVVIAWAVADAARAPEPAQRVAVVLTQIAYLHRRPY